tara:strand:- start:92 stop:229 length:138 start_codon:yes stop_codon:yes gene_type:complete
MEMPLRIKGMRRTRKSDVHGRLVTKVAYLSGDVVVDRTGLLLLIL